MKATLKLNRFADLLRYGKVMKINNVKSFINILDLGGWEGGLLPLRS